MNENIVTNRAYRILQDKDKGIWDKFSFWTRDCDVYRADGFNLQDTLKNIDGITDSTSVSSDRYGLSAKGGKSLYDATKSISDEMTKYKKSISSALKSMGVTISEKSHFSEFIDAIKNIRTSTSPFIMDVTEADSNKIDMKKYTNRWKELTNVDFICGCSTITAVMHGENWHNGNDYANNGVSSAIPTLEYNAQTGELTFDFPQKKNEGSHITGTVIPSNIWCVWLGTYAGKGKLEYL